MNYLRGVFSFSGRINRLQYTMVMLVGYAGSILVFWLTWPHLRMMGELGVAVGMANLALITWVLFAAMAKRFHDFNRSGLSGLRIFVPLIGLYTPLSLFFIPGDAANNEFGRPPIWF
ncbi:uncharacterized membrane protein YhaH (DUF805 family) [Bradyrhizobium sp. USDA 4369]